MSVSRKTSIIVLAAVAVVAIGAALYTPTLLHWNKAKYGNVSVQEAKNLIDKKPDLVILDVRTVSEFGDGHIQGAINIPVEELSNRLSELSKSDELLVYCRTGNRSATAVGILEDTGFTKIYHMHDGISTWIQEGYPVVQ